MGWKNKSSHGILTGSYESSSMICSFAFYSLCGKKRIAVIYDAQDVVSALAKADELREEYDVALYEKVKKVGKLIDKLEHAGFDGFYIMDQSEEVKFFGAN